MGNFYYCPTPKCGFKEIDELQFEYDPKCNKCHAELKQKRNLIDARVEQGCSNILEDLKRELKELSKYRIPPQFFGHAAKQAIKSYQDDQFYQFDHECVNYIVDFEGKEARFNGIGILKKELPIEVIDISSKAKQN